MLLSGVGSKGISNDGDFSAIKKKIDSDYLASKADWQTFWAESSLDVRLEAGDISLVGELGSSFMTPGRQAWYFNRVRPLLNLVSGHQRRTRASTIVQPLESGDQVTADQFTKLILGIYKRENVYESISSAFHQGACITGLNLLHVYIDFRDDPINGDIKIDNLAYNQFYIDPLFRRQDLSDCSFVWRRSYLSYSEACSLWPDKYEDIMHIPANPIGSNGPELRFQYMPESYGISKKNKIAYDEYYYRAFRKRKLLLDKQTGESLDVSAKENLDIERFLAENTSTILITQDIPTVRLAIMMNDVVISDGPQPLGIDRFPFSPVIGYYNSMMPTFYNRIQGLARSLRDPQLLLNRRIILSAELLESQANSGWIFRDGAVMDVNNLFQTGAGRIIPMTKGANMADLVPIVPPQIPPSFFQLQETFSSELNMVSGINEELMGSALDDKAGILSVLRQGAGLTTLQPIFDRLNLSQNMLGEIILQAIQANYTPGKIKNMLEGEEPAPLFYNKAFGKYHCMIEQGFHTEHQKGLAFSTLLQLKEMGVNIPPKSLINAATVQKKTELIKDIEEMEQQASQVQQAQVQAEVQESQARAELAKARAVADQGLGLERVSRIEENKQLAEERKAQAHKDDTEALLAFLRAAKEIEGVDLEHLGKLIEMQKVLKEMEQPSIKPASKSNNTKGI